jgi:hypothetical protein
MVLVADTSGARMGHWYNRFLQVDQPMYRTRFDESHLGATILNVGTWSMAGGHFED